MLRTYLRLRIPSLGSCRSFHICANVSGRSYTREPNPVPGSDDHLNPNGWAERLFKLHSKSQVGFPVSKYEEPPMLHMICRLVPLKGVMHFHKAILEKYGLGKNIKNHTWVVVKNTPSVNQELYHVKHLIKVQPVELVDGLPVDSADLLNFRLLPDGRFVRYRRPILQGELVATDSSKGSHNELPTLSENSEVFAHSKMTNSGYLTRAYLRQWHNRRWSDYNLFGELFTSHYKYKLNQDGKEYRYSRLWRLDDAMFHSIQTQRNSDGTLKQPNQNRFEANWNTYPWSKF